MTEDLPCTLQLWTGDRPIGMVTRNRFCFEFAYLTGTTQCTGIADTEFQRPAKPHRIVVYFIHHALIIQFALWNVVVDGMLTNRGAFARTLLSLLS
ncbi:MAG: hypothetical protein Ct9H300mP32_0860 [Verrucomicrobiota bacterium]|nr:MAG: hypothetical protein Ct9H300mP32_0860 [Verrucomicrobiota bacterium]